jgi:Tol biopolymer transport system component
VVFVSIASNLVPDDNNETWDVFVHDLDTGATKRVSVASDGTQGDNESNSASISDDGRFVAFRSSASNLVPDDTNDTWDVFAHDRQTGATRRVSVALDGTQGNGVSWDGPGKAPFSGNGGLVAFQSEASNLVPGDTNGEADVFVTCNPLAR